MPGPEQFTRQLFKIGVAAELEPVSAFTVAFRKAIFETEITYSVSREICNARRAMFYELPTTLHNLPDVKHAHPRPEDTLVW